MKGLMARGGIMVDVYWKNGKLDKADLYAQKAAEKQVIYLNESRMVDLKPGEKYTLHW
jgi:hypothetical protein